MKAESRLFLRGPDGEPSGPFRWTIVREWVALGLVRREDEVLPTGQKEWGKVASRPELLTLPAGGDAEVALLRGSFEARPVGARAAAYLLRLRCPIPIERLNPQAALHCVRLLEELSPTLVDANERWAAEQEAAGNVPAATPQHATAEQIARLRERGVVATAELTRLEARRLLSGPPTAEQIDRLKFCGISLPPGACQDEAAELISREIWENWSSEEAYQAQRRRSGAAGDPAGPTTNLKLRPRREPEAPPAFSRPVAASGVKNVEPHRRGFAVAVAIAVAAGALVWVFVQRDRHAQPVAPTDPAATAGAGAATAAPRSRAVTVLQASTPALGEKLKAWVLDQQFSGIVAGEDPRALINGRLCRVGDVLDRDRGVAVVQIDAQRNAVVVSDAAGTIVQRVLE